MSTLTGPLIDVQNPPFSGAALPATAPPIFAEFQWPLSPPARLPAATLKYLEDMGLSENSVYSQ